MSQENDIFRRLDESDAIARDPANPIRVAAVMLATARLDAGLYTAWGKRDRVIGLHILSDMNEIKLAMRGILGGRKEKEYLQAVLEPLKACAGEDKIKLQAIKRLENKLNRVLKGSQPQSKAA